VRRPVVIALLVLSATPAATASPASGSFEPTCRIAAETASRATWIRVDTRCNFEQTQVRIDAGDRIGDYDPHASLAGRVDPEDYFTCGRDGRSKMSCSGRAGRAARVRSSFQLREPRCRARIDIDVWGGVDCEPGQACIDVGYSDRARGLRPNGC
jgi:hypothetical protein